MSGPTLGYLELFQKKKDKSPKNAEGRDEHARLGLPEPFMKQGSVSHVFFYFKKGQVRLESDWYISANLAKSYDQSRTVDLEELS